MQTMNAQKYEAITEADAWLHNAGLPSYSKLRAVLWQLATTPHLDASAMKQALDQARQYARYATPEA